MANSIAINKSKIDSIDSLFVENSILSVYGSQINVNLNEVKQLAEH